MNGIRSSAARVAIALGIGAAALPLLAGCGAGSVPADEVEEKVSAALAEQVGQTPDEISCPEDLPAEVGAEMKCELTAGTDTLGVTVTVTSVDGSDVEFDIAVDELSTE